MAASSSMFVGSDCPRPDMIITLPPPGGRCAEEDSFGPMTVLLREEDARGEVEDEVRNNDDDWRDEDVCNDDAA